MKKFYSIDWEGDVSYWRTEKEVREAVRLCIEEARMCNDGEWPLDMPLVEWGEIVQRQRAEETKSGSWELVNVGDGETVADYKAEISSLEHRIEQLEQQLAYANARTERLEEELADAEDMKIDRAFEWWS